MAWKNGEWVPEYTTTTGTGGGRIPGYKGNWGYDLGILNSLLGGIPGMLFGGGGKGTPPDLSFYEGWGQYPKEAVTRSEKAIREKSTRWLEDAMRGIRSTGYSRGLGESSYIPEMGDIAASEASGQMAGALASLYQWADQMVQQGDIAGKMAYTDILKQYQSDIANQGNDNFIAQLIPLLSLL